jgi:hypothetical protein
MDIGQQLTLIGDNEFAFIKIYDNEEIFTEFRTEYRKAFNQMVTDAVTRTPVYIEGERIVSLYALLQYIHIHPYLKQDFLLVLLFLSQTIMSLPVGIITSLLTPDIYVSEPRGKRYYTIHLDPCSILVKKNLTATRMVDVPEVVMEFEVEVEVDFSISETSVYIQGREI